MNGRKVARMHNQYLTFSVLAAMLGLSACATAPERITVAATPEAIAQALGRKEADFTMRDGMSVRLAWPRPYGEALCGVNLCVSQADIDTVTLSKRDDDNDNSVLEILAAPVLVAVAIGTTQPTRNAGGRQPREDQPKAPKPSQPPETTRSGDEPLYQSNIANLPLTGRSAPNSQPRSPNAAFSNRPWFPRELCRTDQTPTDVLTDDSLLLEWAWDNRAKAPLNCLTAAAAVFESSMPDRALEMEWFALARTEWNEARCRTGVIGYTRVSPHSFDAPASPGDPALILRARAVIKKVVALNDTQDLAEICAEKGGVAPRRLWDERRSLVAARLDPFNRDPLLVIGDTDDALGIDANMDPETARARPAIRLPAP